MAAPSWKITEQPFVAAALIFVAVFVVFWPVTNLGFINFDDPEYVTENPPVLQGLSVKGAAWAWRSGHAANWHPVTWISHMLDCQIYGTAPKGHHFTNLALHAVVASLMVLALNVLTGRLWLSFFAAALFAIHPLRVESVAWISERKDLLSGLFFAVTLYCYGLYSRLGGGVTARKWSYVAALLFFALGLMSKPMLVTLPFVLLLLDYWPLKRVNSLLPPKVWIPLLLEKIPFFALAFASSVVTYLVQKTGGAVSSVSTLPVSDRLQNAVIAYVRYLGKIFWPSDLAVFYPHTGSPPGWQVVGALLLLSAVTALVIFGTKRAPFLATGWFWFLGMLVPVIGLVQVGSQSIADRYTYLPSIGICVAALWGFDAFVMTVHPRRLLWGIISLALIPLVVATRVQITYWKDSESLFRHAIASAGESAVGHFCVANALFDKGHADEGMKHLLRACELDPSYPNAQAKLGYIAAEQGDLALAARQYKIVLSLRPDFHEALNNYAWLLATSPDPGTRDGARAVELARRACELTRFRKTLYVGTLAAAYAESGAFDQAVKTAESAISTAREWNQSDLAQKNTELLELYRKRVPFHEQPRSNWPQNQSSD